jgi:outer membrane receptor for ferrienterochelin and colicins
MDVKRFLVFALSLLLLGAGLAFAQESGRIEGKVTREDGTPLAGVSVRIEGSGQTAQTGPDGSYRFDGVPPGTYTLRFSLLDHEATETGVAVEPGATRTLAKSVDWDVSFAETITVTSVSRREERITEAPAAVNVVSIQDIELEAATGQVPKLLEFTPGVDFTQSGLYDINFNTRGFNSSLNRRILTLIDGRDPAVPFLGSQEWAAVSFPLDELSNVELVRGPGSALYGANAFSGVLNMTTRAPRGSEGGKIRLTGGELNTRRGDFRWASELGAGFYGKIVAGYQSSDDFTVSRRLQPEYSHFCSRPGETDCLPREGAPLAEDHDEVGFGGLRLDKYFGETSVLTLEGGTADLAGPTFVTGIGRVQVTDVQRPWGRLNFNTPHWNFLSYYDKRVAKDQVALASGGRLFEDSSNLHGELQGNVGFAGGRGFLVGGAAYNQQKIDTANDAGIQTLMAEAKDEHQEAVFGQVEYNFTDRLKAVVAARVDESTLHDTQFSPKGSLVWAAAPNHTFRLTYNEAFQVANYSEFFLQAPTIIPGTTTSALNLSAIETALRPLLGNTQLGFSRIPVLALGNKDLDVEKIKSYEAGYNAVLGRKAYLTIDYYKSNIENFITDLLGNVTVINGQVVRLNPNFGPYAPPSTLSAQAQAAVLNALRANLPASLFALLSNLPNGQPIIALASYTNFGEVDTQGVDVGLNYYFTDKWLFDFSYSWFDFEVKQQFQGDRLLPNAPENKFALGLTYTGSRFGASVKYRWTDAFPWAAGIFAGNVPSYSVVDLGATYDITNHWQVGLDVSNLLDEEHWQSFGGDLLGRRALAHVSYSW